MYKLFLQAHISDTYRALTQKLSIQTCNSGKTSLDCLRKTSWPCRDIGADRHRRRCGTNLEAQCTRKSAGRCSRITRNNSKIEKTCGIDRVLREVTDITTSFLTHHTSMLYDAKPPKISVRESVRGHTWYSDNFWSAPCQGKRRKQPSTKPCTMRKPRTKQCTRSFVLFLHLEPASIRRLTQAQRKQNASAQ